MGRPDVNTEIVLHDIPTPLLSCQLVRQCISPPTTCPPTTCTACRISRQAGSIYPLHVARRRPITVTATSPHGPWQASRPFHCCDSCVHGAPPAYMHVQVHDVALCTYMSTGEPSQQWAHSPHPCCYREHIHTRSATESLPGSAHASSSFTCLQFIHSA